MADAIEVTKKLRQLTYPDRDSIHIRSDVTYDEADFGRAIAFRIRADYTTECKLLDVEGPVEKCPQCAAVLHDLTHVRRMALRRKKRVLAPVLLGPGSRLFVKREIAQGFGQREIDANPCEIVTPTGPEEYVHVRPYTLDLGLVFPSFTRVHGPQCGHCGCHKFMSQPRPAYLPQGLQINLLGSTREQFGDSVERTAMRVMSRELFQKILDLGHSCPSDWVAPVLPGEVGKEMEVYSYNLLFDDRVRMS